MRRVLTIVVVAVVALGLVGAAGYAVWTGMQPKTYKARFLSYTTGPANIPAARIMPARHKLGAVAPIVVVECRVEGLKNGDMVLIADSDSPDAFFGLSADYIVRKAP